MIDKKTITELGCKAKQYDAYETDEVMTWCSGCGNYSIQNAFKRALVLEGLEQKDVLMCFDIGCNGNGSDKIEGYTIHGLHGRVLPLAAAAALTNPKLKVVASAGDGATLSEGVNHLVHAVRCDYPMMFMLHDNQNYALTTGQASSTTPKGCKMNSAPEGVTADTINPLEMILSLKPSFVARTFSSDVDHMTEIFRKAFHHNGFACVQIMQCCPTYNKLTSDSWYLDHVRKVEDLKKYDKTNIWEARKLVEEPEDKIYVGVLYENKKKENFASTISHRKDHKTTLVEEVAHVNVEEFLKKLS